MAEPGDLAQLYVRYTVAGRLVGNCWGFQAARSGAEREDLLRDVLNHLTLFFSRNQNATASVRGVMLRDISPGIWATLEQPPHAPLSGTVGSAMTLLPPQTAAVATLRTGLVGKSHRGRVYLAGFDTSQQAGGIWNSDLQIAEQANLDALLARYGRGGNYGPWFLVVISHYLSSEKRSAPVGTPVTGIGFQPIVYSQRVRARKR
jgi:hypothetical protein